MECVGSIYLLLIFCPALIDLMIDYCHRLQIHLFKLNLTLTLDYPLRLPSLQQGICLFFCSFVLFLDFFVCLIFFIVTLPFFTTIFVIISHL